MNSVMEPIKTVSAEERWKEGGTNQAIRMEMLRLINEPSCHASTSWKKLPYIVKANLSSKTWTKNSR